ncbi:hypothetical protein AX16_007350 [Volvariella volvacea WC 439]|nr:hypothetical protein AX16_007350 [Volvariella volvacea WC 439]
MAQPQPFSRPFGNSDYKLESALILPAIVLIAQPMSHTVERITIVTSPPPSNSALPQSPVMGQGPTPFRIHERHRTIYVTVEGQLGPEDINRVLALADNPEGSQDERFRRSRSFQDVVNVRDAVPSKSRSEKASTRPTTYYPKQSSSGSQRPSVSLPGSPAARRTPSSHSQTNLPPLTPIASRKRILFYHKHDPYYGFTNFSPHPVVYKGKKYPTSEHLFQSFKFQGHRPNLAEHIRTCSERPSVAFSEARRFQPEVRHDWKHVNIEKARNHFLLHRMKDNRGYADGRDALS